jgi:hypothetical protein
VKLKKYEEVAIEAIRSDDFFREKEMDAKKA